MEYRKWFKVSVNKKTLEYRIKEHKLYLEGKGGRKINFKNADLSYVDLSGLDLSGVCFENCNLEGANLSHCNLEGANFTNANCRDVDFSYSNLDNADFIATCLVGICLVGINRKWTSKKKYLF